MYRYFFIIKWNEVGRIWQILIIKKENDHSRSEKIIRNLIATLSDILTLFTVNNCNYCTMATLQPSSFVFIGKFEGRYKDKSMFSYWNKPTLVSITPSRGRPWAYTITMHLTTPNDDYRSVIIACKTGARQRHSLNSHPARCLKKYILLWQFHSSSDCFILPTESEGNDSHRVLCPVSKRNSHHRY